MTNPEINALVQNQRKYFSRGKTLPVKHRLTYLKKLKAEIKNREFVIAEALKADLGKSAYESYMCEIGLTLSELSFQIAHIKKYAKRRRAKTPLTNFLSASYRIPSPYGVVLIMSPWNYPFLLSMEPLLEAVAAGNTVVLKTSGYAPNTANAMEELLTEVFPKEYVSVVKGNHEENEALLQNKFDYIFFTGSKTVGKIVYRRASETLTPVTLELGGKSPCIVDETANIPLAAKRIVWGKFLNLGQTCVAPDYIFCHESVREKLVEELKRQIEKQFGSQPLENENYGKIINQKHFTRLLKLLDKEKLVCGGKIDEARLKIEPTILSGVIEEDPVMQEEIFGPILPILSFKDISEVKDYVSSHDSPLALYYFTTDKKRAGEVLSSLKFGGGCINDTVIHLATSDMPFGGVGESGLGSYHGKEGFDTFTHFKSVVDKKNIIDLPLRYQPFKTIWERVIRLFLH